METKTPLNFISVRISGDRIRLVPVVSEYAEIIFKEFTDDITRYMVPSTPSNIEEINNFIKSSARNMEENIDLTLVILKKDNDEFLGICGLHGRQNPNEPVLGIWLKKSAHGLKYGQEAIKILVDWARHNIVFKHMVYPCDIANIASRRIAENLKGEIFRTGEVKTMSGRILNEVAYRIR